MEVKLRTLIVDDEPLAREWLRTQVERDPEVEVVGEAGDGFKAVMAIEDLVPDLVFLDIQMPGLDGFGVLETLAGKDLPSIVFVTAFDHYAVRAFDVHALDYILKPFGFERVRLALSRVKGQRLNAAAAGVQENLIALLQDLKVQRMFNEWLLLKNDGKRSFLRVNEIDWIEASRNNVILHCGKQAHVFHETMQGMEDRLDPGKFLRVHRSTIVNIERIKELEPWFNGEFAITLKDGSKLTMSSTYRSRLRDFENTFGN
jgi:two-component system LytT family response regulator